MGNPLGLRAPADVVAAVLGLAARQYGLLTRRQWLDAATLENEWITVKTGMLGGEHLIPYSVIGEHGEVIAVPFDKDQIKSAPEVDKGHASPSPSERAEVFSHFGMEDPGPPVRF